MSNEFCSILYAGEYPRHAIYFDNVARGGLPYVLENEKALLCWVLLLGFTSNCWR